jgi:hypothetical protein
MAKHGSTAEILAALVPNGRTGVGHQSLCDEIKVGRNRHCRREDIKIIQANTADLGFAVVATEGAGKPRAMAEFAIGASPFQHCLIHDG